jgi:hypothetical protein
MGATYAVPFPVIVRSIFGMYVSLLERSIFTQPSNVAKQVRILPHHLHQKLRCLDVDCYFGMSLARTPEML